MGELELPALGLVLNLELSFRGAEPLADPIGAPIGPAVQGPAGGNRAISSTEPTPTCRHEQNKALLSLSQIRARSALTTCQSQPILSPLLGLNLDYHLIQEDQLR